MQVDGVAADVEPTRHETTPAVKEVKPKKKRFMMSPLKKSFSPNNSQDGNSTDDSAHAKPKKNQPLAGRFKHVLCQVKSKVTMLLLPGENESMTPPAAPLEDLTVSCVALPMDAALPNDNAVTA
ncbi:uncharacterized protein PGTG_14643 [Puccinia graminis f. sp. tritici CRL 75-36-700-3]|uniref:Uncharacterized protein n=1 Tax=Puccinia graminis f. sp. tritici (strain CRL 75-36-700-3 / race SCCL) TaxID=418459 RepID=E3KWL0_PUCGT|nr:uncharacterized protein PGTG_14643 [Puccinia graminis f. sp. tritici CRL 75-36-700-3]EFP88677.2 hypothetical protein PGTG_14643 [Puccinia graminis f. sp. tritici CRL 75-36-700-3]